MKDFIDIFKRLSFSSSNGRNRTENKCDQRVRTFSSNIFEYFRYFQLMDLINDQNTEWTSLVQRQSNELTSLQRQHMKEQCELFRTLLDETQRLQTKDLNDRHQK